AVPVYADNNVLVGTGLGAAMGAVIGHQVDHNNGAWVGGAVGAVTGAAIASSNNTTRYVEHNPYSYNNVPRRDIYVVEPNYYQRPPVNVIYVDGGRSHRGHQHHYERRHHDRHRHGGQGYSNQGRRDGRTVVIVR
ncbi:MAG TPA: glycine zipper 2TM domain-containing protein, partial [bacterium]|nr:glycine zipper 2TM domain-containing protein [bacterium]